MPQELDQARVEALGPAERVVQSLTTFTDHLVHNRPGIIRPDARRNIGVVWEPVAWKQEGDIKVVYKLIKQGKKSHRVKLGTLADDGSINNEAGAKVGDYRKPGLFPEVATYLYQQVADVFKLDNEFAARWASWSFPREHRDLKSVLAAFMLVQNRCGRPVMEGAEVLFHDDDFRDVGEAMCLIRAKKGGHDINPKMLLRVGDILAVPGVAAVNRQLGFGRSAKNPALGRYSKAVAHWLRYRENNPQMLEGLVKAGYRSTVMRLARRAGYKPESPKFFELLRWKQKQASAGHRTMAIGVEVAEAESWAELTEVQICERIVESKPNYKRIVGMLPKEVGLTRAVVATAIESGCLSDTDLIILTPTLEDLGLLAVDDIKQRWKEATEKAENQRAANIARNVKSEDIKEELTATADKATAKAMEEATRGLEVYVIVDKSGSMEGAIEQAKEYLTRFLGGIPLERLHVSVFNTMGTELSLKSATKAGVEQAFRGHTAGGGTSYAAGVAALAKYKPADGHDALFIFVGDQGERSGPRLAQYVAQTDINPVAFGMLRVVSPRWGEGEIVYDCARRLGIPCFLIEEELFNDDPYTITRTLRQLIENTPAGTPAPGAVVRPVRKPLVEQILATDLLKKPVWAVSAAS